MKLQFDLIFGFFLYVNYCSDKVAVAPSNALMPGADVAFKVLLSARFCAAVWSHIADCDETFNYWEPLHYLIYGHGLQTWEYSSQFALRSYTYLLIHGVPAWVYNSIFHPSPMLIFYFVRCLLGFVCALIETYFYKCVALLIIPTSPTYTMLLKLIVFLVFSSAEPCVENSVSKSAASY